MHKITLDTDYKTTGNSTGSQIDALAIAVGGKDYNDIEEYNTDYLWEVEDNAKQYFIDNESEDFFKDSLTKEQLTQYADDLTTYNDALQEYKDTVFEDVRAGDWPGGEHENAQKACAEAMEEALSSAQSELWHDWLYGDYRGNFDGILPQANKMFSDYRIAIEYDEKSDTITLEFSDDSLALMKEEGCIERKSYKEAREWVEMQLNYSARAKYQEEQKKLDARRAEWLRTKTYKDERQKAQEAQKREELRQLASKKA